MSARDMHARGIQLEHLACAPKVSEAVRLRVQALAGIYGLIAGNWSSLDEMNAWCPRSTEHAPIIEREVCQGLSPEDQHTIRTLLDLDAIVGDPDAYVGLIVVRDDGLVSVRYLHVDYQDALLVALIEGTL